ncbi:hypothetical protein RJ639_009602 [Escallonia herrerae]|uniref:Malectin-like domain-containing protein n=1 Tax=Escallonia herrerae TaxID=1293975 RepID=A0AA89ARQ3_9ASTE|nr:hypothetical protein RJ639_009602 [Escallonia herrerae]
MEGLHNWNSRLVSCCILCLFLAIQATYAQGQEGFLSIQCCADSNVTEPYTNISWTTDANWYPDHRNCQDITPSDTEYDKARVFGSHLGSKWCYNLTTSKDQDYLIRGTFLSGSLPGTLFNVLIGVTPVGLVNSSDDTEVEGVFKATNDYTDFCLSKENGDPYISKLELRPSNPDYLKRETSSILKLIDRVDVGNTGSEIRYPHDPYDRIWKPEPNPDQNDNLTTLSDTNITVSNGSMILPPIQVLQTARTHPERLEFLHNDLDTGYYEYDLYLYFLEHNDSVQAGQRVFDIYINDEKRQELDILADGSRYSVVVLNFTAHGLLNLTMIKTSHGYQFGPICSAYEILQVHPWVQGTVQAEVDVVVDVRDELLKANQNNKVLRSWSGDPCLPRPWHGLSCNSSSGFSVITQLNGLCGSRGSSGSAQGIVIGTIAGGSVLVMVAVGIYFLFFYKKKMAKGKFSAKGLPMAKSESLSLLDSKIS